MKYNKALDYLVLASQEFSKGNLQNAGRLFAAAQKHPSMTDAVRIIEANNKAAFKAAHPRLAASLEKKLRANSDTEIIEDEFDIEATDENVEEIIRQIDDSDVDVDEGEVTAEDSEEEFEESFEEEEVDGDEIEAVVARMRAAKRGKVKASKARAATFANVLRGMKG